MTLFYNNQWLLSSENNNFFYIFLYKNILRLYNGPIQERSGMAMFPQRLKELRKRSGFSQKSLSVQLGVSQQAVGKWETGRSSPDPDTLARLAALLGTSIDDLMGLASVAPAAAALRFFGGYEESPIPVVGTVRAGFGALAFEEDYGVEYARVKDPASYFYLVVKGDSMEPRISDGDLALVHRQPTLENGDLGVMVYGDEGEGTLKKYVLRGNAVVLQPFNPAYEPKVLRGEELDKLFIAGKVVETKAKW